MSDAVARMVALGEMDARIFELTMQLRRIPQRLAEAKRQLDAEEALLHEVLDPWSQLEHEINEREATIKVALDTIDKFEEHMKRVATQKEYMAARKQVDEARRLNTRLQDEILERRVKQEELTPRLEERRGTHGKVKEAYEAEESGILAEQAALDKEIGALSEQVQAGLKELGGNAPIYYERLVKGGRLPAVVGVEAGSCMGCNMALPPQTYNLLLASNGQLFTCPTCQRILYHTPEPAAEPADAAAG